MALKWEQAKNIRKKSDNVTKLLEFGSDEGTYFKVCLQVYSNAQTKFLLLYIYSYEILSSGLFQCTNQSSPFVQYLAAKELLYKHGDMKDDNSIIFSSNNK